MTNPWGAPGVWTSGRRTYKGNRLVGGVANSDHLRGEAADFAGVSEAQLRKHFGNGYRYLNEGDHIHVSGLKDVPFHGKVGVTGLVNGVDTTAPKGQAMFQQPRRHDPITAALGRMTPVQGGIDPLAPVFAPQPPQMAQQMPMQQPNPQQALMAQQMFAPQSQEQQKPKAFGKGGAGWAILGALGDALSAYGGQRGVYAPAMMDMRAQEAQERMMRERMDMETQREIQRQIAKASEPIQHVNSAGDVVRINPQTREAEVIYFDVNGKPQFQRVEDPATGAINIVNTGSTPRPQADDIEDLRRNPSLAADFDAEFGPGAAAYILRQGGR